MNWWHWVVLGGVALCIHYLEKIRDLIGTIALLMAHQAPENPVARTFLEEHHDRVRVMIDHPSLGRLIWWWRQH